MAFDIHGQPLLDGHCEVHPWVHCDYPCPVCAQEEADRKRWEVEQDRYYAQQADEYYQSLHDEHMEQLGFDPIAMGA